MPYVLNAATAWRDPSAGEAHRRWARAVIDAAAESSTHRAYVNSSVTRTPLAPPMATRRTRVWSRSRTATTRPTCSPATRTSSRPPTRGTVRRGDGQDRADHPPRRRTSPACSPPGTSEVDQVKRVTTTMGEGAQRGASRAPISRGGGCRGRQVVLAAAREHAGQLAARGDVELAERASKVRLDRLLGDEQRLRDLAVGLPVAASSATRRSLGVSESAPARSTVRGRTPIAASSARARRSRLLRSASRRQGQTLQEWLTRRRALPGGAERGAEIDAARVRARVARETIPAPRGRPRGLCARGPRGPTSASARKATPIARRAPNERARRSSSAARPRASSRRPSSASDNAAADRQASTAGFSTPSAGWSASQPRSSSIAASWLPAAARIAAEAYRSCELGENSVS